MYSWMRLICTSNSASGSTCNAEALGDQAGERHLVGALGRARSAHAARCRRACSARRAIWPTSSSTVSPQTVAQHLGQPRIGLHQPAPEGDAVGLVDDPVGIERVQIAEHGLAHQVGVQRRHAVDPMRADKGQVAHAQLAAAVFVDQRDRSEVIEVAGSALRARAIEMIGVDAVDDLQVARQEALEQRHRPAFQRLRQQRVVGVGERALT